MLIDHSIEELQQELEKALGLAADISEAITTKRPQVGRGITSYWEGKINSIQANVNFVKAVYIFKD